MINKSIRKKAFRILLLLMLGAAITAGYTSSRLLKPEKLGTLIENQLSKRLGIPVSINKAALNLSKGLHVSLSDFQIGDPTKDLLIKADSIGVDLSLLKLLAGELNIQHIDMDSPEIHLLSWDRIAPGKGPEGQFSIPLTSIRNGTILTYYKDKPYALTHIHGKISHDFANLNTQFFSSRLRIFARLVGKQWTGQITMDDFLLKELDPDIRGSVDIHIGFQQQQDFMRLTADIRSDSIGLPGGGTPIDQLTLKIRCTADAHELRFYDLECKTADLFLSGTGRMQGPFDMDAYGNTPLSLTFQSRPFDYETVVSHLPVDNLPEWAIPLFYRQIQGGTIRISRLDFSGQLSDLIDEERFFKDLFIHADLSDFSYGAGYGPERVTGVSGTVMIREGDLLIQDLSGYTDHARLQCLDLILPDIMAPDLRTVVNVDLDIPAKEFRYLWRAAMEPKVVYDLLEPLSLVTGGNIKAAVTIQDNLFDNATQVKGTAELNDCSFTWGKKHIENLSGTVTAKQFSSAIEVNVSGKYNQLPVRQFVLLLKDAFTVPTFQFSVKTEKLPRIPDFELSPGASVVFFGSGKDSSFQGNASLETNGFRLFDDEYFPPTGKIQGNAIFSGTFRPEESIRFQKINVTMDSGILDIEYHDEDPQGFAAVKGIVNLSSRDPDGNTVMQEIRGGLDMGMTWGKNRPVSGHLQLQKLSVIRNDSKMIFNGPIEISGGNLSTTGLSWQQDDLHARITGSLSLTEDNQHFTGELTVKGFSLGSTQNIMSDTRLPDTLTANIYITAIKPTLYDIPFEKGEARLQIENNRMRFHDIRISGESGRINGSVTRNPGQKTIMDMELDIRNNGLNKLFQSFAPERKIEADYMSLSGNLQGTTDSINGHLIFLAKDGYTQQSPLLSNIFAAMNLYKIFKTQNIDIRKKHFTFNRISSGFTVTDSIIRFDDFLLDSDSIQFSAVGEYRINDKEINALIGVQPFEAIDKAINVIPIIGWVLTGEGDELFVICLRAEGSIENPDISLAPNDTVSKPVANTLLRLLKLPGRIITQSRDLIREPKPK